MVAKAALIVERGDACYDEILMVAYAEKAKTELTQRIRARLGEQAAKQIDIKTFHGLGLSIIGDAEGERPSVADWADDPVKRNALIKEKARLAVRHPVHGPALTRWLAYGGPPPDLPPLKSMDEYHECIRARELRTLQGELVKSYEELAIANFLFVQQVPYSYEPTVQVQDRDVHPPAVRARLPPDRNGHLHRALRDQRGRADALRRRRGE